MVSALDLLHIDALHYTIQDLENAHHLDKLFERDEVILHLDARHMGVGGDDGWMASVYPEYRIPPGRFHYRLILRPVTTGDNPSEINRTRLEGFL